MSAAPEASVRYAIEMRDVSVGSMRDLNSIVVENVNWSVAPGDVWVISGLQGTGKSDFLMMTGGLMAPVSGTYNFLGEEMPIFEDHRLAERLKLGFVFENGQLFNHLTLSENISLPLRYHADLDKTDAAAEVQKLLELMELAPWADSTPGGGGAELATARRPGARTDPAAGSVAPGQSARGFGFASSRLVAQSAGTISARPRMDERQPDDVDRDYERFAIVARRGEAVRDFERQTVRRPRQLGTGRSGE